MGLTPHDDVHHGPLEEIRPGEDFLTHAASVEVPPLIELALEDVEEVVLFDALDDFLLVVERNVRGDGPGKPLGLGAFFISNPSVLRITVPAARTAPPTKSSFC